MRQDLKRERSRKLLMDSSYELFTEDGFHKTTIAMIARRAGLGKGTFYLYFRDKEDVRDSIIAQKSREILQAAIEDTESERQGTTFYDGLIKVTDYIIDYLTENKKLFKFISKSLSSGLLAEKNENDASTAGLMDLEEFIRGLIRKRRVVLKDQRLFIYTIIEMVNSTCYSPIVADVPCTLDEYKPFLYHAIKLLTDDQVVSE